MNPLPIVVALIRRNPFTSGSFVVLIALAVALGVALTAQERALKSGSARASDPFDLIIAAPGSQTDLLLKTIFLRSGSVELLQGDILHKALAEPRAAFVAPLGFGDSHDGDPVVGTTGDLLRHLSPELAEGRLFAKRAEAVVGARSPLKIGESFEASHGHGAEAEDEDAAKHGQNITVVGRLRPLGSPWDRAIIVPIEHMWMTHGLPSGHAPAADGENRIGPPFDPARTPGVPALVLKPRTIADAYGLRSLYRTERSTAFFPAEVLVDLYQVLGDMRALMSLIAVATQVLVIGAILAGVMLLLKLQRRTLVTLRALGAPRRYLFSVVWLFVTALIATGAALGVGLGRLLASLVSRIFAQQSGIAVSPAIGWPEVSLALIIVLIGAALATIPALALYRRSVATMMREN